MMERMILSQKTKLLHYRLKTYLWRFCLLLFCLFFNLLLFFFQKDKIQLSENNFGTPTCPSLCDAI